MSKRFNLGDKVVLISEDNFTKKWLYKNIIYDVYGTSELSDNRFDIQIVCISAHDKYYPYFNGDFFEIYDIRKDRKEKLKKIKSKL